MQPPLIVVVDDRRVFRNEVLTENDVSLLDVQYFRNTHDAVTGISALVLDGSQISQLWLDHDLGGDDTTWPVVDLLVLTAYQQEPLLVENILIHSMNIGERDRIYNHLQYWYNTNVVDPKPYFIDKDVK
jgi:hypothetical protein